MSIVKKYKKDLNAGVFVEKSRIRKAQIAKAIFI